MSAANTDSAIPAEWDALDDVPLPRAHPVLYGHDQALDELAARYRQGRLHHAWLVHGPQGIGKASFAFRFADHLFRHPRQGDAPAQARPAADGIHSRVAIGGEPNLLLIRRTPDKSGTRYMIRISAEAVRSSLQRFLGQTSGSNAWRVIIIDPAEDMNKESANALLKFLEEPPPRTLFFIIAHSPRGLLATIRSRCQMLALRPLDNDMMRAALAAQPSVEGIDAGRIDALLPLAKGSVRRALLLANGDLEAVFAEFMQAVSAAKPDYPAVHRLAATLSPAARNNEFDLFMDLVREHLSDLARQGAVSGGAGLGELARLAEVREALNAHIARNGAYNLDRKQIFLDLYERMRVS